MSLYQKIKQARNKEEAIDIIVTEAKENPKNSVYGLMLMHGVPEEDIRSLVTNLLEKYSITLEGEQDEKEIRTYQQQFELF